MHPQYRLPFLPFTQIALTCEQCGIRFECSKSQLAVRRYCSRACTGAAKRRLDRRTCESCGSPFTVRASARTRFCGHTCAMAAKRTLVACTCERCGAPFTARPSHIGRGGGRFCSMACQSVWQRDGQPVGERLWLRVDKHGPTPEHRAEYGNCWLWKGKLNPSGYGRIYRHFPDALITHRLAWELATGETLTAADVIGHICDVRRCVRNDDEGTYTINGVPLPRRGHLFKGTHDDNWRDMREKGRDRFVLDQYVTRGADNPNAKLTEAQVAAIRARYATGTISQQALADEYGVNQTLISVIVRRKRWQHVD